MCFFSINPKVMNVNSEIIAKVDNFDKLSLKKKIEFFKWVSQLKKDYTVLREENTILKKGLSEVRRVSS